MPISKPSSRTSAQSRHRWEKHVAQAIRSEKLEGFARLDRFARAIEQRDPRCLFRSHRRARARNLAIVGKSTWRKQSRGDHHRLKPLSPAICMEPHACGKTGHPVTRDNVTGGYGNEESVDFGYGSGLLAIGAFCRYGGRGARGIGQDYA